MGALSIWHILILGVVGLLLFGGRGKVSDLMADVGKGVSSFRRGLTESDGNTGEQVTTELPRPKISSG